jgi:hypothetical protein
MDKGAREKGETDQETKCLRKLLEKQWRKGTREKERGPEAGMLVSDNPNVISE